MPKKTTAIIKETGSDYVIGVKNNQPSLYKAIAITMQDRDSICSTYATLETNKGRIEWRSVAVSNCIGPISKEWVGLQQLVKVERRRKTEKGWQAEETAYFISSLATNALDYMEGIRQHWGIENGLHYVKDMVMGKMIAASEPEMHHKIFLLCVASALTCLELIKTAV